jgi:hypothetical protein
LPNSLLNPTSSGLLHPAGSGGIGGGWGGSIVGSSAVPFVDAGFEAWKLEQMAKLAAGISSSSSRPGASALAPLGSPPAGSSSRGLGLGGSSGAAAADAGRSGYSGAAANRLTGKRCLSVR